MGFVTILLICMTLVERLLHLLICEKLRKCLLRMALSRSSRDEKLKEQIKIFPVAKREMIVKEEATTSKDSKENHELRWRMAASTPSFKQ